MDQRAKITEFVIDQLDLNKHKTQIVYKRYFNSWWQNPRKKAAGGMRLTVQGYTFLKHAGLKEYKIDLNEEIIWNSRLIIDLDNLIDCPFYISKNSVFVFCERMAVQLVLFSGNIAKYRWAKKQQNKSSQKHLDNSPK